MSDFILDRVTLAMVSLAANIPKKGLCQLDRLRSYGVPEEQIDIVVDIARHLRNEAGEMLDHEFNMASVPGQAPASLALAVPADGASCCSPTAKGNACC